MDRCHRIGQAKDVFVYRLVTENTVEQRIIERQKIKLKWDNLVLARGKISALNNPKSKNLTKNELKEIVSYGASTLFKAEGGTFKDEDIDNLIEAGKIKSREMEQKAMEALKNVETNLFDLAMNGLDIY